jgi:hypothetical protein
MERERCWLQLQLGSDGTGVHAFRAFLDQQPEHKQPGFLSQRGK